MRKCWKIITALFCAASFWSLTFGTLIGRGLLETSGPDYLMVASRTDTHKAIIHPSIDGAFLLLGATGGVGCLVALGVAFNIAIDG